VQNASKFFAIIAACAGAALQAKPRNARVAKRGVVFLIRLLRWLVISSDRRGALSPMFDKTRDVAAWPRRRTKAAVPDRLAPQRLRDAGQAKIGSKPWFLGVVRCSTETVSDISCTAALSGERPSRTRLRSASVSAKEDSPRAESSACSGWSCVR
jgi:hypothetical protein